MLGIGWCIISFIFELIEYHTVIETIVAEIGMKFIGDFLFPIIGLW